MKMGETAGASAARTVCERTDLFMLSPSYRYMLGTDVTELTICPVSFQLAFRLRALLQRAPCFLHRKVRSCGGRKDRREGKGKAAEHKRVDARSRACHFDQERDPALDVRKADGEGSHQGQVAQ
jgi:hypothetical protein